MATPLFPDASQDAVAVFNSSFEQVFSNARPLNVRVFAHSRVLDHPLENGEPVSDHKVILPIEITMTLLAQADDYRAVYEDISNLYLDSEVLTVQTRASSYDDIVIAEMPHEERSDVFDALLIMVKMRSVKWVDADNGFVPADEAQTDTKPLGEKNAGSSITVEPDSGVRMQAATGTQNNFFNPDSSYIVSGVAATATPTVISGDEAAIMQTGVR